MHYHGTLQKVSYVQMKQLTRQGWTINLLGIGIVRAAPLIIAMKFTADGIRTTNGVRVEDTADHSWHHHYEDGQDLQKASKNGTCLGLNVVLSSQGTLNNHLEVKKKMQKMSKMEGSPCSSCWLLDFVEDWGWTYIVVKIFDWQKNVHASAIKCNHFHPELPYI